MVVEPSRIAQNCSGNGCIKDRRGKRCASAIDIAVAVAGGAGVVAGEIALSSSAIGVRRGIASAATLDRHASLPPSRCESGAVGDSPAKIALETVSKNLRALSDRAHGGEILRRR